MKTINIKNEKKRDAQVCIDSVKKKSSVMRVLESGEEYSHVKVLKQNLALSFDVLNKNYKSPVELGEAIISSDPEIDMEIIGKKVTGTRKLYLLKNNQIAYRVNMVQVIKNPLGEEKERRDLTKALANITGESIVQWTGKIFPKSEIIRKFVFQHKVQLKHISGLTYDFLYEMAKTLHESKSLMFVGSGKKGSEPLIMTRGGEPYRGFLEGRIQCDKYCLILHLTNVEMKVVQNAD